jgi:cytochrome c oxidase cbb3-type subunit 1
MEREDKLRELEALKSRARQLEQEIDASTPAPAAGADDWRTRYYAVYNALAGAVLGMFGAAASLLFNVIGSLLIGQDPLRLVRIYLTFPLGDKALDPKLDNAGLILSIGCCLYLATGMLLGMLLHLIMTRFYAKASAFKRFGVMTMLSLGLWIVNFYLILSWLQPALIIDESQGKELEIGGNWIVRDTPWWIAALTHLVFGWTMLVIEPLGEFIGRLERLKERPLVNAQLCRWYFLVALCYMGVSLLGGLIMAFQLINHNPLRGIEMFSPGRWRMVHTNAIAYGFLANAFLGMLHWVIPRLTLRPVLSERLSYFIFAAWQVVVLSTAVGILFGHAQGIEWGETPVWIDPLAQAGLLLVAVNFMAPIVQKTGPMYVTTWYFTAAFVWTFLTYAMGNFLPEYFLPGTGGGAVAGLFIHDLVGLFVTPLGWGAMYYFVPILMKKPIWSHGLSLVGFWGLAFFYPLTGIHHFLYTPIPMFLQYGAVISTIAVEFVVLTVIVNFFGTVWGNFRQVWQSLPLRWFYTGMVMYGITCFQCAIHTTLTFQKIIHFTDWVVGHAHLVMLGVFAFWLLGIMTYLFPRLLHREWYSQRLCVWHYWLSSLGLVVMFVDLTIAGLVQGFSWAALEPWDMSVVASRPYWITRAAAGLAIILGQILFVVNIVATYRSPVTSQVQEPMATVS